MMLGEPFIYVVDDDEAVRDSLVILLESAGHKVRSFPSGTAFLEQVADLAPGCVLLDVRMPDMDGLQVQELLNQRSVKLPVIIMTGHGEIPVAVRAMKAGAVDFIEKPFTDDVILASIAAALARAERLRHDDRAAADWARRLATLSPREQEVLQGLIAGHPNKTIAHDLGISPRTVEIHRARVMEKMQARSLSELVRMAVTAGVAVKA